LIKLIFILLMVYGGWQYYQDSTPIPPAIHSEQATVKKSPPAKSVASKDDSRFSCDGRQHCSQMNSRAEAVFFINHCPNTKMDGDYDGIPCENDSRF